DISQPVETSLSEAGCRVLLARHDEQALKVLHSIGHIDLLISDIMVPGTIDGVGIAREARRLRPSLCIVLTSGDGEEVARQHRDSAREFEIMPKPFTLAQLLNRVARCRGQAYANSKSAGHPILSR
ncbi:MAG: response regulator, partial [Acetobacteraceae bacterium]|nr:response regulator [Acetobacteraceae bacterium]